ncbi:hypothetical protein ACVWW1_000727 [Bradyrhizobium sp. JR3.5]
MTTRPSFSTTRNSSARRSAGIVMLSGFWIVGWM